MLTYLVISLRTCGTYENTSNIMNLTFGWNSLTGLVTVVLAWRPNKLIRFEFLDL